MIISEIENETGKIILKKVVFIFCKYSLYNMIKGYETNDNSKMIKVRKVEKYLLN